MYWRFRLTKRRAHLRKLVGAMGFLLSTGKSDVAAVSTNTAATAVNPSLAAVRGEGVITSQTPQAGRRVVSGETVHVTLGALASAAGAAPVPRK